MVHLLSKLVLLKNSVHMAGFELNGRPIEMATENDDGRLKTQFKKKLNQ